MKERSVFRAGDCGEISWSQSGGDIIQTAAITLMRMNSLSPVETSSPKTLLKGEQTWVYSWADTSLKKAQTSLWPQRGRESTIRNTLTRASPTATQHSHDSNQTAEVMFDSRGRFISATAWHHQLNTEINKCGLRETSPASSARSLRAGRNENRCQVWYDHCWCESPQGCTYWPVSAKVNLHKALNLSLDYLPLSLWHYNILIIIQIYLKIKGSHLPVTDSTRILSSAQSFKSLGCFPAKPQSCTHPPGRHTLQQFGPKITLTQWHSLCRCL